ncbi:MAG: transporter, partial [Rhodoferax sp.]|nr:transporter [Rhodoferax sp.]
EPTNHLDLATREALAMALNEFEGTVMLVSHDRALLRSVCDEFWMVSRGGVEPFDGDLDDYQRYLLDESKRLREEAKNAAANPAPVRVVAAPVAAALPATVAVSPSAAKAANPADQRRADSARRDQQSKQTRPLQKELEKVDQAMARLQAEKGQLEDRMSQPLPPAELANAGKRLKAVGDELATLEENWLSLSEQIESARTAEV